MRSAACRPRDILQMLAREQGVTFDHIAAAHEKEK